MAASISGFFWNHLPSYEGCKYVLRELKVPILDTLVFHYFDKPLLKISYMPLRAVMSNQGGLFHLAQAVDSCGVFKHFFWSRVAWNTLTILANVCKGYELIYSGWQKIKKRDQTARMICGIGECALGGFLLAAQYHFASNLVQGIPNALSLDPDQMQHVVKENAIHHLSAEKTCKAVALRGPLGPFQDPPEQSFIKSLYQECQTRMYAVDSDQQLCKALQDSSPDVLLIFAHANPSKMKLGPSYSLSMENQAAIECIDKYMPSDSQVFLAGCNTATETKTMSFAENLSKRLIDKEVTGVAGYVKPLFTYLSRMNNKFQLYSYVTADSEGRRFFFRNGARTF